MLTCASVVRDRISAVNQPTASPIANPPAAPPTKRSPASPSQNLPLTTAATATRYATSAVASLNRPSASTMFTNRRGTPRFLMIVAPASGSVGDTTAPSVNAAGHDSPSISACAPTATALIV